ncbi:MAG: hypothetical protein R3D57_18725 [Hyphomicrobiaceae bacterium]
MRATCAGAGVALAAIFGLLVGGCEPVVNEKTAINRTNKADPLAVASGLQKTARALEPTSANTLAAEVPEPIAEADAGEALARFHKDLLALASGARRQPVTILHFGDDHITADRFSSELRRLFQSRFGDAGRGLIMPAGAYRFHRADGIRLGLEGDWTSETVIGTPEGGFSLTGVRVLSTAAGDSMTLDVDGGFDTAEVTFAGGPDRGKARVSIDGQAVDVPTRRKGTRLVRSLSQRPGTHIEIRALQSHGIAVTGITLGRKAAGIRYVNLGLPGADIDALAGLDQALAGEELRQLSPSLIVFNYGSVSALNDSLDLAQYAETATSLVRRIHSWSPGASIVVVGPPDTVRLPDYAGTAARDSDDTPCRALAVEEIDRYPQDLAAADPRLARWHPPINMAAVRKIWRRVAAGEGAVFWDWQAMMGGDCSIHAWIYANPPLAQRDHSLMTEAGYRRSAAALFQRLVAGMTAQAANAVSTTPTAAQ